METFINTTAGPYPWLPSQNQSATGNTAVLTYAQNITVDASSGGHNTSSFGVSNTTVVTTIAVPDDSFPSYLTVANSSADAFLSYKVRPKGAPISQNLDFNA
jgi:hypothetical protein